MPRKSKRGGTREGTPGRAYPNRTDLSGPKVVAFRSGQYGQGAAQARAQQALPIQNPPSSQVPQTTPAAAPPQAAPLGPDPGSLGGILDPTNNPAEPLTAGAPFGPGPGPEALPRTDPDAAAIDRLRMLYRATGSPSLGRLLEAWEDGE